MKKQTTMEDHFFDPYQGGDNRRSHASRQGEKEYSKNGGSMSGSSRYDRNTPERTKEGGKQPTKLSTKKTHWTPKMQMATPPKAAKIRNLTTKPVSAEGMKMTIHSSQTRDAMTQGWQGHCCSNHQTKSYPHEGSKGQPHQHSQPQHQRPVLTWD